MTVYFKTVQAKHIHTQRKSHFRHGQLQADARCVFDKGVGLEKRETRKYFFLKVNVHKDSKGGPAKKSSLESLLNQQGHRCPWSPSVITVPKCQHLGWLVESYLFVFCNTILVFNTEC